MNVAAALESSIAVNRTQAEEHQQQAEEHRRPADAHTAEAVRMESALAREGAKIAMTQPYIPVEYLD